MTEQEFYNLGFSRALQYTRDVHEYDVGTRFGRPAVWYQVEPGVEFLVEFSADDGSPQSIQLCGTTAVLGMYDDWEKETT